MVAVCLAGASPSVHFGLASDGSAAVFCVCVTDERGPAVSERERERIVEFCYFWILNSAVTLEICRKIITAPKILKIGV